MPVKAARRLLSKYFDNMMIIDLFYRESQYEYMIMINMPYLDLHLIEKNHKMGLHAF